MSKWLTPDAMFRTYDEITPAYLRSLGVRAVLADIDNTLAPYEQALPDACTLAWAAELRTAGIGLALISNNDRARRPSAAPSASAGTGKAASRAGRTSAAPWRSWEPTAPTPWCWATSS